VGAEASSTSLRGLLKSLCMHLCLVYKHSGAVDLTQIKNGELDIPDTFVELKRLFKKLLSKNYDLGDSMSSRAKVVVLIDGIERLRTSDHAEKLDWLPNHLSRRCKLILSVSDYSALSSSSSSSALLIKRLKQKYTNKKSYAELGSLDKSQVSFMLRKSLESVNSRLNAQQTDLIERFFETNSVSPLHFKLLADEFLSWKSFTKVENCMLMPTLNEAIACYFSKLEAKFGYSMVKHALGEVFVYL
jgi:hypothetical protein